MVIKMRCPLCSHPESKVVDSRPNDELTSIKRRRECLSCGNRFTTYETVEVMPLMVIKKDKTREMFDKVKLLSGMIKACHKRPVTAKELEKVAGEIEITLRNMLKTEVPSTVIGEIVMEKLYAIDKIAYVRFASIYREFRDVDSFMDELKCLVADDTKEQKGKN